MALLGQTSTHGEVADPELEIECTIPEFPPFFILKNVHDSNTTISHFLQEEAYLN
jgi:hypothetical protein